MANIPKIIRKGDDPNCVHYEDVDSMNIAVCRHCHRVADYNRRPLKNVELPPEPVGVANLGKPTTRTPRQRRRSALGSRGIANHYVGRDTKPLRPERRMVTVPVGNNKLAKKVLIRGRDF